MTKILIVGGGIIGLASALLLYKQGFAITILDRKPFDTPDLDKTDARVYAINPHSQTLLQQLNVWPAISKRAKAFQAMHVWDSSNQQAIDFNCRDIAKNALGHIVEESVIKAALLEQIQQCDIRLEGGHELTEIESNNGITIKAGKKYWQADKLIAADGANSWCRRQLNIGMTSWDYNNHAIVTNVRCEKSHCNTAWQVFTEQGVLAFLPMQSNNQCSIVWSSKPAHAKQLMQVDSQQFNQQLAQTFEHKLGKIIESQQRFSFPLTMRHVKQYVGENWLILGDAAHTIHPLAGQGMNLGLSDVAALTQLGSQQWRGAALQRYQRSRKSQAWKLITAMEGFKQVFAADYLPGLSLVRGWGIQSLNRLKPVKRLLIELAS